MITLTLPYPPSVNNLYATVHGRKVLSKKGREYHQAVVDSVTRQLPADQRFGARRVGYTVQAFPPDRRRRDLSNLVKALEDALTYAKVWDDDSQVDRLTVVRGAPAAGGSVFIEIDECVELLS